MIRIMTIMTIVKSVQYYDFDYIDVFDHQDDKNNNGLPANSHNDKIPPWWENVSNG